MVRSGLGLDFGPCLTGSICASTIQGSWALAALFATSSDSSGQQDGISLTPASPQVTATDADSGPFGLLSYSLGAGLGASGPPPFRIDAHSGDVCTTRILDRDQGPSSFDFTVTAVDGVSRQMLGRDIGAEHTRAKRGPPDLCCMSYQGGLKSMVYVKVFVSDENDNPPQFYPREYAASLSAQSTPGTAVLRVRAHDPDQGPHGRLSYHILAGNSPPLFALDEHSGKNSPIPVLSPACIPIYLNDALPPPFITLLCSFLYMSVSLCLLQDY